MRKIISELGPTPCRRCINTRFKVHLEPKDCVYGYYMGCCSSCKRMHHIVLDLRLSGKLKTLFKK